MANLNRLPSSRQPAPSLQVCSEHCYDRRATYMATQHGNECWCSRDPELNFDRHTVVVDGEYGLCNMYCYGNEVTPVVLIDRPRVLGDDPWHIHTYLALVFLLSFCTYFLFGRRESNGPCRSYVPRIPHVRDWLCSSAAGEWVWWGWVPTLGGWAKKRQPYRSWLTALRCNRRPFRRRSHLLQKRKPYLPPCRPLVLSRSVFPGRDLRRIRGIR